MRTIVWFRGKDLRLRDHAPLNEAMKGGEVVPLFVLDPYFFAPERARRFPHRIQFLLESLESLQKNIEHKGSRLVVVSGKSTDVVPKLAARWRADRVVAHRWTEPFGRERDRRVQGALSIPFELFEGETLLAPGSLRTQNGAPYSVFTPFSRAFFAKSDDIGESLAAPSRLPSLPLDVEANSVAIPTLRELGIDENPRLVRGGEAAARERLQTFFSSAAASYHEGRERMDWPGTSRLSQDLKFGVLSPRVVWNEARRHAQRHPRARESLATFQNELVWREFAFSTLWDRPEVLREPFRAGFVDFPWRFEPAEWEAWASGTTGYPVVDAAARQLLGEGFVHNRARMIAASFLTKHLLIHYQRGEAHYLRYLTDGDWAPNNLGWQWSAGSGCDAQPYFRVFNPVSQGEKFDPDGAYVRRWIPELANLPARWIHRPWEASTNDLVQAGVALGKNYPRPIVDHAEARARYLAIAGEHLQRGSRPDASAPD